MPDGVPLKASLTTFNTFIPRHSTLGVVVIEPYKGLLLLRQSGPKEAMPMNLYASYFDPFSAYWFCLMKLLISSRAWLGFSYVIPDFRAMMSKSMMLEELSKRGAAMATL